MISYCDEFDAFWKPFPDELNNSGNYNFRNRFFNKYCPNNNCDVDIDIVNDGCLWLFNNFFGSFGISLYRNTYKDMVVCVMIWLSYKLNQKTEHRTTKLNDFYSNYIQNRTEYAKHKPNDETYDNYNKILDEIKEYMDIDINNMSKFYELLKLLCSMNTANTKKNNSSDFLQYANKFVNKYEKLLNNDNNNEVHTIKYYLFYSNVMRILEKTLCLILHQQIVLHYQQKKQLKMVVYRVLKK